MGGWPQAGLGGTERGSKATWRGEVLRPERCCVSRLVNRGNDWEPWNGGDPVFNSSDGCNGIQDRNLKLALTNCRLMVAGVWTWIRMSWTNLLYPHFLHHKVIPQNN